LSTIAPLGSKTKVFAIIAMPVSFFAILENKHK